MSRLKLPDEDADIVQIIRFAARYNAYERWAQTPEHLYNMVAPIIRERDSSGRIPAWAGVDALRALLFYEYRADHHQGGSPHGERLMRQVVEAIRARQEAPAS
jgi:hypothetical protein